MSLVLLGSDGGRPFAQAGGVVSESLALNDDINIALIELEEYRANGVLILEGGCDVHPSLYGQPVTFAMVSGYSVARDFREATLLRRAIDLGMWTLGICRGHQLAAVMMRLWTETDATGTLYQDLRRDGAGDHGWQHSINWENNGRAFFDTNGAWSDHNDVSFVNSLHHQGVAIKPQQAQTLGTHNGLIEALYYPHHRILTCQWHPEMMYQTEPLEFIAGEMGLAIPEKDGIVSMPQTARRINPWDDDDWGDYSFLYGKG